MREPGIRTTLIVLSILLSGAAAHAQGTADSSDRDRPNIVFILADDLGLTDINGFDPLGRTYYETPNIDRLAAEGMVFRHAYTNGANCSPTRAALISGQYYPHQPIYHAGPARTFAMIGADNARELPLEKLTVAEALREAGYVTAIMGKWHIGDPPEFGPRQQGFDINIGGYQAGNPHGWEGGYFEPNNNAYIDDAESGEYLTDYLTRKAIRFIGEHRAEPFFLFVSYYTPHVPLQAPEALVRKYERKPAQRGHANPAYAAMIESLDSNVGKLLDALDEFGLAENSMVVFYSDNGGVGGYDFLGRGDTDITDNAPLKGGKGTYYEGGIRVPLAVRWPAGIQPGTESHEPVIGIDFYPTWLDVAGAAPPGDYPLDGLSLTPLFDDPNASLQRETLYWHFPGYPNSPWRTGPVSAVRSGDWKLMKFYETDRVELYNLARDPGEQENLAGAMPVQRDRLLNVLEDWLRRTNAPLPAWPDAEFVRRTGRPGPSHFRLARDPA